MPLYLKEHQLGFDTQLIGFPGLGNCMALALFTRSGLYGFHFPPAPSDVLKMKIEALTTFVKESALISNVSIVYGSCRFGKRYNLATDHEQAWKGEMTNIAAAIGYRGQLTGCNLSAVSHGEGDDATNKSVYLEYLRISGATACSIRYKRMSKIELTQPPAGTTGSSLGVSQLQKTAGPAGTYKRVAATHSLVQRAGLDTSETRSAHGRWHSPDRSALVSFRIY